jgi:hypothetical protein
MGPFFTCLKNENNEKKENSKRFSRNFTPFLVKNSTVTGHNIPANVPTPLDIPIRILAYRGAISR